MVSRAFAVEDGNLSSKTLTVARKGTYTDIDLTLALKTGGDIYKKTEAASVKQAVRNLLLTNWGEKPFQPRYGGDLRELLFQLTTEFDDEDIKEKIITSIETYEPRAEVTTIRVTIPSDQLSVRVTVNFRIINTGEDASVQLSLTRLR